MRFLPILPILFLLALLTPARSAEPTYTYTMTPSFWKPSDRLRVWMDVREKGESCGVIYFEVPLESKWRRIFEEARERDKTEEVFFEARFSREIPPPRDTSFGFNLGIVTEQNLRDLSAFGSALPSLQSIDDAGLIDLRFITENEHLGVTPRIVPDPNP